MTQKAEEKFQILWTSFKEARALRTGADDAPWIETREAWASFVLTEEGAQAASAHLDVMSRERRAFKRLLRHAKRHGAEMLPAPVETAAPPPAKLTSRPTRTSRRPVGDGARAVRAKAGGAAHKASEPVPVSAPSTRSPAAKLSRTDAKTAKAGVSSTTADSPAKPAPRRPPVKSAKQVKASAPPAPAPKSVAVSTKTASKAVGKPVKPAAKAQPRTGARRRPGAASPKPS